jgi:hypothetical protein
MGDQVWPIFSIYAIGAFLWMMIFRHIKYIFSIYGGKYIIALFVTSLASSILVEESVGVAALTYLTVTFCIWASILFAKGIFALVNSESFQRGRRNYNNLGLINEDWAPQTDKFRLIGGAKPPPQRNSAKPKGAKKDKLLGDGADAPQKVSKSKSTEKPMSSANMHSKGKSTSVYSPAMKLCATCGKWGGDRKLRGDRSSVTTDGTSVRGQCLGGGFNRMDVGPTGRCNEWEKWTALR